MEFKEKLIELGFIYLKNEDEFSLFICSSNSNVRLEEVNTLNKIKQLIKLLNK